jgi:RNA polymerase sigma-70 factor (ECF subfamily)
MPFVPEQYSDIRLIQRMQLNDVSAFAEIYTRHKRGVYEYCFRLLQNRQSAEDATQNTFIKVQLGIHQLREITSFKAWMFTIARNEVYAHLRRARSNGLEGNEDVWEVESAHEGFVNQEQAELVQKLLAELKPEYREVLLLVEYEQMSYAEFASITGATISSVESRIFKARKALGRKLKPYL